MGNTPQKDKRLSSQTWIIVHIFFPLIPFFLAGSIRYIVKGYKIDFDTFSTSTLAISIGLLCMLVNQSLLASNRPLIDKEELESIHGTATMFFILAIIVFALFGILVAFGALLELKSMPEVVERAEYGFGLLASIISVIAVILAIKAQRCYKLRARI